MDDTTRKLIHNCSRVISTTITATILAHLRTGEKYSDRQMEHIFDQSKGVVFGDGIIHPYKTTARNVLEVLDPMSNQSYLELVHDLNSEILSVNKTRVCNKKLCKEMKKVAQLLTLLTKLNGKKPSA
jgi:hypothetical protein